MMFTPLQMRPLVTISQVAHYLGVDDAEVRSLCIDADVELFYDPMFGELMNLVSVRKMYQSLSETKNPMGFDRQSLLDWFARMLALPGYDRNSVRPRQALIAEEIARIANMEEPARTMRAAEFWAAYCDARDVAAAIKPFDDADRPRAMVSIDRRMTDMFNAGRGRGRWPGDKRPRRKKLGRNYKMRMAMTDRQKEEWELAKAQSRKILGIAKDKIREELGWAPLKRRRALDAHERADTASGETGTTASTSIPDTEN
jgi:hypothetical protein